jgi:hypothetical protein
VPAGTLSRPAPQKKKSKSKFVQAATVFLLESRNLSIRLGGLRNFSGSMLKQKNEKGCFVPQDLLQPQRMKENPESRSRKPEKLPCIFNNSDS